MFKLMYNFNVVLLYIGFEFNKSMKNSKPKSRNVKVYDCRELIEYLNKKYSMTIDHNELLDDNIKNDAYCRTATWSMTEELKEILVKEFGTDQLLLWVCW